MSEYRTLKGFQRQLSNRLRPDVRLDLPMIRAVDSDDAITPLAVPGAPIRVADLLP